MGVVVMIASFFSNPILSHTCGEVFFVCVLFSAQLINVHSLSVLACTDAQFIFRKCGVKEQISKPLWLLHMLGLVYSAMMENTTNTSDKFRILYFGSKSLSVCQNIFYWKLTEVFIYGRVKRYLMKFKSILSDCDRGLWDLCF